MRLEVEDLAAGYGEELVIDGLSFSVEGPGLLQILGPNGSGKTTLLRALLGLLRPVRGRVLVNGEDITGRPEEASAYVGYVPQHFAPERHYPITVWELITNSYMFHKRRWPRLDLDGGCREAARKALEVVDLPPDTWHRSLWELSGGQRQRALIARALVHDPPILMMDEPLSPVDPVGRYELAEHIGKLASSKLVLVTSHDPTLFLPYTKAILLLNRSFYIMGEPDEVLTLDNLTKVYGSSAIAIKDHVHICDSCR